MMKNKKYRIALLIRCAPLRGFWPLYFLYAVLDYLPAGQVGKTAQEQSCIPLGQTSQQSNEYCFFGTPLFAVPRSQCTSTVRGRNSRNCDAA